MTMTESPPTEAAESSAAPLPGVSGLYGWLTTSDHKVIARTWLYVGLLMLVAATALGVAISAERLDPASIDIFGGTNGYVQMWALYRFGLVFLVAVPLFIGLATAIVPMQVGSTNIAFPRAAAAAAWGYLLGAVILIASVLSNGGWGAVDGVSGDERDAIQLTLLGTGLVVASIMLASICIATTVISLRTPGMGLTKTPLFAWSMLITATVWILTFPVLIANLVITYVDLLRFNTPEITGIYSGDLEPSLAVYGQLAWIFEQPAIYSVGVPVLGVASAVIPVVAKGRQVSHPAMMALIGLAGLLAVGGWSQPFFSDERDTLVYVAFGVLAVLPVLGVLGGNMATLMKGEAPVGIPPAQMVGALGATLLLLLATIAGALRVIEPLDLISPVETTATTGVMNLALYAAVLGALAGWWFWAPKTNGKLFSAVQGAGAMSLILIGTAVLGLTDVIAGFAGAPDVMLEDVGDSLVDSMVVISFVGAIIVLLGVLGADGAITLAVLKGDVDPGDDPWDGHTLEWATSSPPPAGNFAEPPAKVLSEAPLLDAASTDDEGGES